MILFRLILIIFAVYLGFKIIENIFKPDAKKKSQVKGQAKNSKSLNLSDKDIEDAKYKDVNE